MRGGVIVAGGRSTRFGEEDKVVADLAGVPMIRRVAEGVESVVDELVVNCRADQRDAIERALSEMEVRFAEDPDPDLGPMAGIHAGLTAIESEYSAVVAADMPFVEPGFLSYLFERAEGYNGDGSHPSAHTTTSHDAVVPQLDDRWFQTTQAVYRTRAMATACAQALERGDRKIVEPLFELDYVVVGEDEIREHGGSRTLENLNTREEFETAVERLSQSTSHDPD